ncbi:unnamed protein product, partial [marine sediment metagenome]
MKIFEIARSEIQVRANLPIPYDLLSYVLNQVIFTVRVASMLVIPIVTIT